jgi:uncharacterized protein (DUF305 family)
VSTAIGTEPTDSRETTAERGLAGGVTPTRRRYGPGMLALATVVGLLLGFAVATLLNGGEDTPGDTSAEAGFARDMINHHAQAVELGLIAFDRASEPGVRQVGYDIATAQQGQIGMMNQWLTQWGLLPTGSEPPMAWMDSEDFVLRDGLMPGMATQEQMQALREAEGEEVDRLFLEYMIYHHLGGIHMVDEILTLSDEPDVTEAAQLIKDNQQYEVAVLQGLQDRIDGTD